MNEPTQCDWCDGAGGYDTKHGWIECGFCNGRGYIEEEDE